MPLSRDLNCLFIHIPKTAGTSIEKMLGVYGSWDTSDTHILYGRHVIGDLTLMLQHATMQQLLEHRLISTEEFETLFKFAFVRNPWDRIVSDYAWHKRNRTFSHSFRQFVDRVCDVAINAGHGDKSTCHYVPQRRFIYSDDGKLLVDFVGKFESLKTDLQVIASRLSISHNVIGRHQTSRHLPYPLYFTPYTYKRVQVAYEEDIDTFKYKFI